MMIPIKRRFLQLNDNEFLALCRDLKGIVLRKTQKELPGFKNPLHPLLGPSMLALQQRFPFGIKRRRLG